MAFFSGLSSSIGKKLLLYGLRHIDILDKDPADFVSVDVGKRTTLEVRDVGLHVKKLVALLHLKLPPEIHLSKAQASLLRVTFVLDFGVPQISIEVDGIQVQARLLDDVEEKASTQVNQRVTPQSRASPPRRPSPSSHNSDDLSDASTDEDEHVPTVDELAKSFIREEPAEEIRELEQELESQSAYLQESTTSSDDGDDEGSAGMGAPLALPVYLRNILNTALDRLSIVVNNIDVEVEDQSPLDTTHALKSGPSSPVSLNFHIERIGIDSPTSKEGYVEIEHSAYPLDNDARMGKRRMRVENICAQLVSDAENFVSMSRLSQPSSPITARSEVMARQSASSEPSSSHMSAHSMREEIADPIEDVVTARVPATTTPSAEASSPNLREKADLPVMAPSPEQPPQLASSVHTIDEDRFADATSDDGLGESSEGDSPSQSRQSVPFRDLGGSSILYDDEGLLDYAMQHNMLDSRFDDAPNVQVPTEDEHTWGLDGIEFDRQDSLSVPASEASTSTLPTVSALGRSFRPLSATSSPSQSRVSESLQPSTDNLFAARQNVSDEQQNPLESVHHPPVSPPLPEEDLAESQLFTHDDAESMYMSAVSAAQPDLTHQHKVPGGWDSSSTSSRDTASDRSGSIPDEMVSGSILAPLPEAEEGCETPRPGSRQSLTSSPQITRAQTPTRNVPVNRKQAKVLLTIDGITVWFPLGLDQVQDSSQTTEPTESSGIDFKPPNLGEDSIFAEMPGSFSNYAHSSSHRRKPSLEASVRARPNTKSLHSDRPAEQPKSNAAASISIEVGSVVSHVDISTGKIMLGMFSRVIKALAGETVPQEKVSKAEDKPKDVTSSIELSAKHVSMAWLENVLTESFPSGQITSRILDPNPLGAILRVNLSKILITSQSRMQDSRAKLQIGTFVLASLDQELISFQNSRPRSRRSIGSLPEQLSNDVEIDFELAKDKRITVVTRPIKVMLDIQKLDDALSSFGGFSGVLELSSSMSSANTIQSPVLSPNRPRPRGVHFGDSLPPSAEAPTVPSTIPKIQVQFGEVSFTLKGSSCAVQLQTTSVRVAVRASNVRLKVTEIQLSGPFVEDNQKGAPLLVEIRGTTVNFLFAPEETDLARLISMITPSKDPYENDDDILIDTLLRQRRKGSVLRVEVSEVGIRVSDLDQMKTFEALGAELARLSKVTKYLPDDDRPGLLTLASVKKFDAGVAVNEKLGDVSVSLQDASVAHVGVPALLAVEVGKVTACRDDEILVHEVVRLRTQDQLPAMMVRMVGDEMEPVVKAKFFNLCAEYRVSTIMAALGMSEDGTADEIALGIASSVATITGASSPKSLSRQSSQASSPSTATAKPLQIDMLLRSCAIGLNPRKISSKGLFVLTEAHIAGKQAKSDYSITLELRKASMHAIDDIARLEEERETVTSFGTSTSNRHLHELAESGFVSLSSISAAKIYVNIAGEGKEKPQLVDVEFKNELFVLESCADSTQTLIAILNGLQPPTPPSTAEKYRTVVPLQEMMESFTGDAFAARADAEDDDEAEDFMSNADLVEDEVPTNLEFVGSFYNSQSLPTDEELGDSLLGEDDLGALATPPITRQRGDRVLLESFQEKYEIAQDEQEFDFSENYFKDSDSDQKGKARKWDSAKNQYHLSNEFKAPDAPLKVRVRDVNIIWNLYDGYDWPRTRGIIAQAVDDVEARAEERRRKAREEDEDDDFVEEDFLFNSVWIGVPIKDEKGALARRINHDIDDLASETGSYATSTATRSTGATARPRSATKSRRRLKLERSKHKKIAFSLMGVAVDLIVYPPNTGETINSIDVRVQDLEVFDHVPTSTWKKFVTCQIAPSARELSRPMLNLELVTVKPVTDLAASELVIKVTVLPLRLHVDQDALDFITRFFEFKDDSVPEPASASEQPFIQRLEVKAVSMKLDYKPKRVDYGGLRSGHTTEFMNFLILDGSDIVLRHAIVYGITSFDKLNKTLNDVWMPDVKRNQLPGVLSGLAAVRPLVDVGSGIRDLVVVPMREYKKDGRIVRSLQKGVYAFAKNTTSEVARLGAKVAIGTQNLLEGAEVFINPQTASPSRQHHHDWDGEDPTSDTEEPRAVSNYANQPIGVRAGLRSAARHLERDLLTARDAVIAIPAEVMEEGSGAGMARALARHAPTVILRPALGATKALSNALLGVGNALDKSSRRKIEDKYKSY
ncbi:Nn.00g071590.m01.CDS01 [Neocucurbitaria sp. VM-36]